MKYRPAHILEYILFRIVAAIVLILPLHLALALAWLVAAFAHFILRIHVRRTRARIREVFGDSKPEKEVRRIAWLAWRNLCFTAVESIRFPSLTLEKVRQQPMARFGEDIKAVLEKCDGGFILATPHYGNWELAGITADLLGIPIFVIVRKQKNPLMDAYMNRLRRSFDVEVLYREAKMWKGVADRIAQGKVLALLPDIRNRAGITVDYLNNQSTVAPGAAHFAQIADCPVYTVCVRRIGWTKHDAVLSGPILPDPQADKKEDQHRIMQEIMRRFEEQVFQYPEQYFWFNKRWVLDPVAAKPRTGSK